MNTSLQLFFRLILLQGLWLSHAIADLTFQTTALDTNDVLNIRAKPNPNANKIGEIPANTTLIKGTGQWQMVGKSLWQKVQYQQTQGWVNSRYLKLTSGYLFNELLICGGTEPFWDARIDHLLHVKALDQHFPIMNGEPAKRSANQLNIWSFLFHGKNQNQAFAFLKKTGQCNDGMSEITYQYEMMLRYNSHVFSGCCNPINTKYGVSDGD